MSLLLADALKVTARATDAAATYLGVDTHTIDGGRLDRRRNTVHVIVAATLRTAAEVLAIRETDERIVDLLRDLADEVDGL